MEEEAEDDNSAQFDVNDTRTLNEVVDWLLDLGHVQLLYGMLPGGYVPATGS